jgi:hypothetical protein
MADDLFMDISSQEEDEKYTSNAAIKPRNLANTGNLPLPLDLNSFAQYIVTPVDELPVIKSIQDVIKNFPHMQSNPETGEPNCLLACNKFQNDMKTLGHEIELKAKPTTTTNELTLSSSNKTAFEIKKYHATSSEIIPWQIPVFETKIRRLTVPNWYFDDGTATPEELMKSNKLTQEQFHSLLRKGVFALPELKADMESELLGEAGAWTHIRTGQEYYFPPCKNGFECIGYTHVGKMKGLEKPMILMQILFPQEYTHFMKTTFLSNSTPKRPCVLCCRDALGDWVTALRADKMQGGTGMIIVGQNFQDESKQVLQFYSNPKNQDNGYAAEFMLHAQPNEPIIESLVTLNLSLLECKSLSNGRRRIDQSALFYKSPIQPKPQLGETLQNF